mmetsp:Transcript_20490/g.50955  ORF Transcript_20490/g.50955 Transcript_20490/m.50955 type:complete len:319 (-) Transcript_20490:352-1308(-)
MLFVTFVVTLGGLLHDKIDLVVKDELVLLFVRIRSLLFVTKFCLLGLGFFPQVLFRFFSLVFDVSRAQLLLILGFFGVIFIVLVGQTIEAILLLFLLVLVLFGHFQNLSTQLDALALGCRELLIPKELLLVLQRLFQEFQFSFLSTLEIDPSTFHSHPILVQFLSIFVQDCLPAGQSVLQFDAFSKGFVVFVFLFEFLFRLAFVLIQHALDEFIPFPLVLFSIQFGSFLRGQSIFFSFFVLALSFLLFPFSSALLHGGILDSSGLNVKVLVFVIIVIVGSISLLFLFLLFRTAAFRLGFWFRTSSTPITVTLVVVFQQ